MNKLEQAARQALEALEELHYSSGTVVAARKYELATAALREALAEQAEQEPVAELFLGGIVDGEYGECEVDPWQRNIESLQKRLVNDDKPVRLNLYTAPVRTKDLTEDEIDAIEIITDRQFARAVIAADREKNSI